jgi:hypothetical protein
MGPFVKGGQKDKKFNHQDTKGTKEAPEKNKPKLNG